jgi:aminoglycoside/choline kinase family phosphotransferase
VIVPFEIPTLLDSLWHKEEFIVCPLTPQGSDRRIFRAASPFRRIVVVCNDNLNEHQAHASLTKHFLTFSIRVPHILFDDPQRGIMVLEDLGEATLFDLLQEYPTTHPSFSSVIVPHYKESLRQLTRFQIEAGRSVHFASCYPRQAFDEGSMQYDMGLFVKDFLSRTVIPYNPELLDRDRTMLSRFLVGAESSFFLYRDFQSRNIVVNEEGVLGFVDFQGGRRGPLHYDVVSLLYQSRAQLSSPLRAELLDTYLSLASSLTPIDTKAFHQYYTGFVLIRLMQVLGRYAKLGFEDGKVFFRESIPYALENLAQVVNSLSSRSRSPQFLSLPCELPTLRDIFERIIECGNSLFREEVF